LNDDVVDDDSAEARTTISPFGVKYGVNESADG
jgi:hypothetical protein